MTQHEHQERQENEQPVVDKQLHTIRDQLEKGIAMAAKASQPGIAAATRRAKTERGLTRGLADERHWRLMYADAVAEDVQGVTDRVRQQTGFNDDITTLVTRLNFSQGDSPVPTHAHELRVEALLDDSIGLTFTHGQLEDVDPGQSAGSKRHRKSRGSAQTKPKLPGIINPTETMFVLSRYGLHQVEGVDPETNKYKLSGQVPATKGQSEKTKRVWTIDGVTDFVANFANKDNRLVVVDVFTPVPEQPTQEAPTEPSFADPTH